MKKLNLAIIAAMLVLSSCIAFTTLLVLLASDAFAGQGHEKRVTIHGKHEDRRAIESLADDSEDDVEIYTGPKTVMELKGRFKIDANKPVEEAAVNFIDRHRNAFGLKNPKEEFKVHSKSEDKKGNITIQYEQMYKGIRIWDSGLTVTTNKQSEIIQLIPNRVPTPDMDTNPLLSSEEALKIAKEDLNIPLENSPYSEGPTIVIFKNQLCYLVWISVNNPLGAWRFFINAKSGKIVEKSNEINYGNKAGTGIYFDNIYAPANNVYLAN